MSGSQFFYLRDVLGRLDLFPVLALAQVFITLLLAGVLPRLVAGWGKKACFSAGCVVGALGGAFVFLAPEETPLLGLAGLMLGSFRLLRSASSRGH